MWVLFALLLIAWDLGVVRGVIREVFIFKAKKAIV